VHVGLFWVYEGLFLRIRRAPFSVCSALLSECRALLNVCSALLSECRALLNVCRALLSECRALLNVCKALYLAIVLSKVGVISFEDFV